MIANNELKLHFVNVNHGDATIIEFPDYGEPNTAHFAVADFGAKIAVDRGLTRDYMDALATLRRDNDANFRYRIDFVCVTHPHNDHYGGLSRFLTRFADAANSANNMIDQFWDCGFRTNSTQYNQQLDNVAANPNITFIRVAAGCEFKFGEVQITALAPSIDLRNRYDTFGVGKNDASIVLRIKYRNSYIVFAADAEFASWGKTTEEFPRSESITLHDDALGLADRDDTADQLRCDLLKLAHHGSKHGSNLEYLERLEPNRAVIPAGSQQWYQTNVPNWVNMFPHPLISQTLTVLDQNLTIDVLGEPNVGNVIYKYARSWGPRATARFAERPGTAAFAAALRSNWA